jgi:hypothetical protein
LVRRLIESLHLVNSFGGLVAVINRDHTDSRSLVEANQFEDEFFTEMLEAMSEAHPELAVFKPKLEEQLATSNAIRLLDGLFHNHIKTSWLPRALASMEPKMEDCRQQLASMGLSPRDAELTVESVRVQVVARFQHESLGTQLIAGATGCFAGLPAAHTGLTTLVRSYLLHKWTVAREWV